MKLGYLLAACLACAFVTPAMAATQGTIGPTSTGTVTINASITPEVNISNLDDFTFSNTELRTALNTGSDASKSDNVCVWSNNVDGGYFVTATGNGAANAFTITDGTKTAAYVPSLTDNVGGNVVLVAGTKSAKFTSSATSPTCNGGTNAALTIRISSAIIGAMEATTTYSGVLTLLVTPS